jgi:quercetin dioxygenase-like cupin family protein
MKTNNIENQTKTDPSDPVEEITSIPRSVVAMAKDFPNGHLIPFHQHARSQLLYASSGVMTVTTANGIWVVPSPSRRLDTGPRGTSDRLRWKFVDAYPLY